MKIYGGVHYSDDGLSTSIRSMHLQASLLTNISDNIAGFNKVGYQRKENVVSSFSQYIGANALSTVKDECVGRLSNTEQPLDFALGKVGYFQCKTSEGIKLTRDGRFSLDKDGYLLTLDGNQVLSRDGMSIKFDTPPEQLTDVKVSVDGAISVFNRKTNETDKVADMSVVLSDGTVADKIDVRQGFTEDSNVRLQDQFFALMPVRRNLAANRQLFLIQNERLTQAIQKLGSSS